MNRRPPPPPAVVAMGERESQVEGTYTAPSNANAGPRISNFNETEENAGEVEEGGPPPPVPKPKKERPKVDKGDETSIVFSAGRPFQHMDANSSCRKSTKLTVVYYIYLVLNWVLVIVALVSSPDRTAQISIGLGSFPRETMDVTCGRTSLRGVISSAASDASGTLQYADACGAMTVRQFASNIIGGTTTVTSLCFVDGAQTRTLGAVSGVTSFFVFTMLILSFMTFLPLCTRPRHRFRWVFGSLFFLQLTQIFVVGSWAGNECVALKIVSNQSPTNPESTGMNVTNDSLGPMSPILIFNVVLTLVVEILCIVLAYDPYHPFGGVCGGLCGIDDADFLCFDLCERCRCSEELCLYVCECGRDQDTLGDNTKRWQGYGLIEL